MKRTFSDMPQLGASAMPFALPNANPVAGKPVVSLEDYRDSAGLLVAFICNHCPFVVHIKDAFADFVRQHEDKNLATVAICSNDAVAYPDDSLENMAAEATKHRYPYPYLHDASQQTARDYKAACTPEFFLYDGNRKLHYCGRFDDSTPNNNRPITGADLSHAAHRLLAGQPAETGQTPSVGCSIKWK